MRFANRRSAIASLVVVGCLSALGGSRAVAQGWEEIGLGSGTPPGIFSLPVYDPSVNPALVREDWPQITGGPSGQPSLIFTSPSVNQAFNTNRVHALVYSGGEWNLLPAENRGQVLGNIEIIPGGKPSVASFEGEMLVSGPAVPLLSLFYNLYAGVYDDRDGWIGIGGSLKSGGLTGSTASNTQIYDSAPGFDLFGGPYLAYSRGTRDGRALHVIRYLGTSWVSVPSTAPGAVIPIPVAGNNVHLTMGFSGAGPVIAWCEQISILELVKLVRYNTSTASWEELSGSYSLGLWDGRRPAIANLPGRNSFIIASENIFNDTLTIKEWNGTSFVDLGDPLAPWGLTNIAPFDDRFVSSPEPSKSSFALALDLQGRPVIAFRAESPAGSGRFQIFVSYRNSANAWVALGDTQSGTGASSLDYTLLGTTPPVYGHHSPSVWLGPDNRPIVSWLYDDGISDYPMILTRRYTETLDPNAVIDPEVALVQLVARLNGVTDPNPSLDSLLDDNEDGYLDAADVERFVSRF